MSFESIAIELVVVVPVARSFGIWSAVVAAELYSAVAPYRPYYPAQCTAAVVAEPSQID